MSKLLRKKDVAKLLDVSTSTIDRRRAEGTFPKNIDFGGERKPTMWLEEAILEYKEKGIACLTGD